MASVITCYESETTGAPRWTKLAFHFFDRAPDPGAGLRRFTAQFESSSAWSGSLASIVEANATLLDQLDGYPALEPMIVQEKDRLRLWVCEERKREEFLYRKADERFE